MNTQQAKEILALYRPGTADREDPTFAEALAACDRDPELKRWLEDHCAVYETLRARFKETPIPEGLKEQILAERKIHTTPWRRPAVLAAVVAFLLVAVLAVFLLRPRENAYLNQMVSTVLRGYGMVEIKDPEKVLAYFIRGNSPSNYAVPAALQQKAALAGCAVETWEGAPVSMLCYDSGNPRFSGLPTDLWLLVVDSKVVPVSAPANAPAVAKVNRATTASWTADGKTYVLIADGDEAFLRKYL
jgi:hypothetical protein